MKAKAKTRGRWKIVLAGLLVVIAVVVGGYFYLKPDNQPVSPSDSSHEVGAAGGTFSFHDGIEITVPEGAVEDGTTLTVGDISQPEHAPFDGMRTGAVMFDVSLAKDGNDGIQPAVPLDIAIPLQGNLLPDGANPESALLYTANESGDGFWYVPPPLDENGVPVLEDGVVYGKLFHLSPKYVSYLDEGKFLEEFGMINGGIAEPEDCLESVETSAGEVELGPKDGWSNTDPASPINVCLAADGDGTHVGIVNRLNYVLSVASTTDSDQFNVSFGGFDEEMVKLFAEAIFPNPVIDTFLGRGGELDVAFAPDQLPATIQLQANPNTYLSEIGWFALKFLVNVFTGGATNTVVQAVLETADVASCLQTTFDIAEGDVEGFGLIDAINYISSKCVEVVAKAVGYQPGFWDLLGRAFNVVAEGIAGGLQTIMTAFEGIRMQFVGNLTVEVARRMPECPTDSEVESIVMESDSPTELWSANVYLPQVCEDGWAVAYIEAEVEPPTESYDYAYIIGFTVLLNWWENEEWTIVFTGQDMDTTGQKVGDAYICDTVPPTIKERLMCR